MLQEVLPQGASATEHLSVQRVVLGDLSVIDIICQYQDNSKIVYYRENRHQERWTF